MWKNILSQKLSILSQYRPVKDPINNGNLYSKNVYTFFIINPSRAAELSDQGKFGSNKDVVWYKICEIVGKCRMVPIVFVFLDLL